MAVLVLTGSSVARRVLLLWYLLSFSGDEIANGFAEEAGQERVERWVLLQEVIEDLQERLVSAQFVVNNGHIWSQELTSNVGEPGKPFFFYKSKSKMLEWPEHYWMITFHFPFWNC